MHHLVINLIKTTAHQMQDFQLEKHQKTFGGLAPPGPAGELKRSPRTPSHKRGPTSKGRGWEGSGRGGEGSGGKGKGEGKGGDPQGLVDIPHVQNPEKNTGQEE